ncbi:MAG: type I-F CRISPR-associated endoribonuclease Cas6/Csy4 [Mariprofundaceae bacterium]|nr:type I-F CRISPR-associated endoribonuclease Cas6/Csy4 [Mariprofundaceae bacterium]
MKHYIDVQLKPDEEMRENVLLNKVYTKLHKALCTMKATDIGVSFPQYHVKLGDVIRIHGSDDKLAELQAMNWLGGLAGYCGVGDVSPIPTQAKFRTVSRIQSNMTESKSRRLIKRGSLPPEDAKQYKAKMFSKGLDNPYLELESGSNGHKHRRYIQLGELLDNPVAGEFDQFGLSKVATVPWFE